MSNKSLRSRRPARRRPRDLAAVIRRLFASAHEEGRQVMPTTEFLLAASVAGLTPADLALAIEVEILRFSALTGYWLKEGADPGFQTVFAEVAVRIMRREAA
jgi:hypothetical protein